MRLARRFYLYPLRRDADIYALALAIVDISIIRSTNEVAFFLTSFPHPSSFHCLIHGEFSVSELPARQQLRLGHAWLLGAKPTARNPVANAYLQRLQTGRCRYTHGRKSPRATFLQPRPRRRLHGTVHVAFRQLRYRGRR